MPATRFQLVALPAASFQPLFGLDSEALAQRNIQRIRADGLGHLCRVALEEVPVGRDLLLLAHAHHRAASPYAASGPIFVGIGASTAQLAPGEVPEAMRGGLLSIKAYDRQGDITGADVIPGPALEDAIARFLTPTAVDYLHLHFARRGCYACRVERVD